MEELQSTELLDREILEDARKKVLRILKTTDDAIKAQTAEWKEKTSASINDLEKKYGEHCKNAAVEIMARLPIDKRRAKAEKIESLLKSAVESWYAGVSRAKILDFLSKELAERFSHCEEKSCKEKVRAVTSGLDQKEAENILKSINADCIIEDVPAAHIYPSIMLETGEARIVASMQKTIDFLLQEKRAELAEALLGRAFLEDE
ncbi:MAG: hypothetical protein LBH44_07140 [Treponema sp.]|jgi:hypothetical protein|nr:hypothetical protein [Treponema sp.]